jgi:putative protein kinase ArgK-like GTPase of G3E family
MEAADLVVVNKADGKKDTAAPSLLTLLACLEQMSLTIVVQVLKFDWMLFILF